VHLVGFTVGKIANIAKFYFATGLHEMYWYILPQSYTKYTGTFCHRVTRNILVHFATGLHEITGTVQILFYFINNMYHIQTACVLFASYWVIPRSLNFIYRRFGTHCLVHLHRHVGILHIYMPMKMEQTECSETSAYKI
jgi:hypothetical protein